jgi:hypothetical protein
MTERYFGSSQPLDRGIPVAEIIDQFELQGYLHPDRRVVQQVLADHNLIEADLPAILEKVPIWFDMAGFVKGIYVRWANYYFSSRK